VQNEQQHEVRLQPSSIWLHLAAAQAPWVLARALQDTCMCDMPKQWCMLLDSSNQHKVVKHVFVHIIPNQSSADAPRLPDHMTLHAGRIIVTV
jgi:hypothetical protein